MSLLLAAELPEVGPATGVGRARLAAGRAPRRERARAVRSRTAGPTRWGHILGVLSVVASFVIGLLIFMQTLGLEPAARTREQSLYDWISVAALQVDFGLRIDPLSLTFVLLITGVGGLIHIYAVGYMAPKHGRPALRNR